MSPAFSTLWQKILVKEEPAPRVRRLVRVFLSAVSASSASLQTAFHGTSVHSVKDILLEGFAKARNTTAGKKGVYCERSDRRVSCLSYMTHSMGPEDVHPNILWSAIVECIVNRDVGSSVKKQWVQPPDAIAPVAVYLHAINANDLMKKGFVGWFQVEDNTLQWLAARDTRWGRTPWGRRSR